MTFTESTWDTVPTTTSSTRVNFLKVENGKIGARIRVASQPVYIESHWASIEGKAKKVNCAGADCLLCRAGVKPQGRYNFYVLDKTIEEEPELKVYEAPATVFNNIASYAKDADLGNPTLYDIKIKKEGAGKETRYSVMPLTKSPLTDKEKELLQDLKPLKEIIKPSTNEYISSAGFDVLAHFSGGTGAFANAPSASPTPSASPAEPASSFAPATEVGAPSAVAKKPGGSEDWDF